MAELEILFSDMGALAAICLIVGMIFSIIEIFNPGFGFFGITGIVLTLLGMILAVTHTSSGNPVKQFFLLLLLEIIVLTLAFGLMAYSVKKGWISRTALVEKNTAVPEGATEGTPKHKELIGKTGETITELRPVGKAKIDDKIYDVTSEDGFVDKGVGIEVVAAEGVKITVRKI